MLSIGYYGYFTCSFADYQQIAANSIVFIMICLSSILYTSAITCFGCYRVPPPVIYLFSIVFNIQLSPEMLQTYLTGLNTSISLAALVLNLLSPFFFAAEGSYFDRFL
jgi:hypothetical protein